MSKRDVPYGRDPTQAVRGTETRFELRSAGDWWRMDAAYRALRDRCARAYDATLRALN